MVGWAVCGSSAKARESQSFLKRLYIFLLSAKLSALWGPSHAASIKLSKLCDSGWRGGLSSVNRGRKVGATVTGFPVGRLPEAPTPRECFYPVSNSYPVFK